MKKGSEFERLEATWNQAKMDCEHPENSMNENSCVKFFIQGIKIHGILSSKLKLRFSNNSLRFWTKQRRVG